MFLLNTTFTFSPAGIRGTDVGSDIAIDDISFSGCSLSALCPDDAFTCGGLECIPTVQQCDFTAQCSDGSDESMCGAFWLFKL